MHNITVSTTPTMSDTPEPSTDMQYDARFIHFCKYGGEDQSYDFDHNLYCFIRYLLRDPRNQTHHFFDRLYADYCCTYNITPTDDHRELCKFYLYEECIDDALQEEYHFKNQTIRHTPAFGKVSKS